MRFADRLLIAALVAGLFATSAFCIDLGGDTTVIIDNPGGTASLAGREFGQPLHEEATYTFLLNFMSYLQDRIDNAGGKYEIEITGALPSSGHNEIIDFHLIDRGNGTQGVLYRYGSSASYKRAAIAVKRTGIPPQKFSPAAENAEEYRVLKGQTVNVILISGVVTLEIEGVAMESGSGADRIKVKVRDTGREFVGSIAGPLEVHVGL